MTDKIMESVVAILTAIIGVAVLSVIVSKNSNTTGVISAGASGFAQDLNAALSPITGGGGLGSFGNNNTLNFNAQSF